MMYGNHPYEAQKGMSDFPIPDEVLLEARLCDLGVRLEDTLCQTLSQKLLKELHLAGLRYVTPQFYLADEWFCPTSTTAIAVPFWLAHPRLKQLERSIMGCVEGETKSEFMKLLRHEAGHCLEHAYRLSRLPDWKEVFGDPKKPYRPESYRWDPKSRDFVQHIKDGYAQSHPEEDFAETFAVWLDPNSKWQKRYKDWSGALAKLNYVDQLMKNLGEKKPAKIKNTLILNASRTKKKLREVYKQRLKEMGRSPNLISSRN